ncbi:MAG: hypothetical protein RLZZ515_2620, partial [Cyanobacteriota bacterium]
QTLQTVALGMVDTLANLDVLPEITETIRRAIREPMAQPARAPRRGRGGWSAAWPSASCLG